MAEEFFKGLGRYIPPEIRRFAPAVKTVAELLKPNPVVNNPNTANLLRSPTIANIGKVLSDAAITTTEVLPGGKLITTPVKKVSKLAQDAIEATTKKSTVTASDNFSKATKSDTPLNNALRNIGEEKISQMTNADLRKLLEESYGVKVGSQAISKKKLNLKPGAGAGSGNQFDQVSKVLFQ